MLGVVCRERVGDGADDVEPKGTVSRDLGGGGIAGPIGRPVEMNKGGLVFVEDLGGELVAECREAGRAVVVHFVGGGHW